MAQPNVALILPLSDLVDIKTALDSLIVTLQRLDADKFRVFCARLSEIKAKIDDALKALAQVSNETPGGCGND